MKNIKSINLYKTRKYKENQITLFFTKDKTIENEGVYLGFLSFLLRERTKRFNSRELEIERSKRNIAGIDLSVTEFINNITLKVNLRFIDKRFNKKTDIYEILDLLDEVLFNPVIVDNKFDQKIFNKYYKKLKLFLETIKENTNAYMTYILNKEYFKDTRSVITEEFLKEVNSKNILDYYYSFFRNSRLKIFLNGNFNYKTKRYLKSKYNNFLNDKKEEFVINKKFLKTKRLEKDENANKVSIIMIYKLANLNKYEKEVILPLYNKIFGNSMSSRLFKKIREEKNYCYFINSSFNLITSSLFVETSVINKNLEDTLKLIEEEKEKMKQISDLEFKRELMSLIYSLENFDETLGGFTNNNIKRDFYDFYDNKELLKLYKNLDKKEVENLNKKIVFVTYYLRGDLDED